ncbi:MAG: hypothetical protein CMD90_00025 [Gammaproteobacteria bacterium]|nr:hypothetical protein [Gammaproteobacteria bacterium]|tara:strand:+ start:62 stop:472 length:411 start_codon:yes stop_codon:yes gene_type:complete
MNIKILISAFLLIFVFVQNIFAEDPFSRSFSTPSTLSTDAAIIEDTADGIHPMMKHSVSKYYVKGVIVSSEGSIAVMSLPGGKDYIMFAGDPLGNDMHTIQVITQDYIIVGKNSSDEEITITVSNPVITPNMSGLN